MKDVYQVLLSSTVQINQLESKVSLITTRCLRLFVVVYEVTTAINHLETKLSLKTICCLRLFVVVYKHVMLQHQRK